MIDVMSYFQSHCHTINQIKLLLFYFIQAKLSLGKFKISMVIVAEKSTWIWMYVEIVNPFITINSKPISK